MQVYNYRNYHLIDPNKECLEILDHMDGFTQDFKNPILERLKNNKIKVRTQYIFNEQVKTNYPNLSFQFTGLFKTVESLHKFQNFNNKKNFRNFLCSFNGTDNVARQFLTATLFKMGWFNSNYTSKMFGTFRDRIDGNIDQFFDDTNQSRIYRKFIIDDSDQGEEFYKSVHGFEYQPYNHLSNINVLADKINSSFIQIVSESVGVSYHPFPTEKFVYPLVCKTLWLAYSQPLYHDYLEKYCGFKKYDKVFDYSFDTITNPVKRLIALMSVLHKFSYLSADDWHDLYLIENDTIEHNYNHYYSKDYLKCLQKYTNE